MRQHPAVTIPNADGRWRPIVDGVRAEPLASALTAIATDLSDSDVVRMYGESLSGGSAGVAVFFAYLARWSGNETWMDVAASWLTHAVKGVPQGFCRPALFAGTTGVAWTIQHLASRMPGPCCDDFCRAVDTFLLERVALAAASWTGNYDLVSGLVGIGVYALERSEEGSGRKLLSQVIARLAETAESTSDGVTWGRSRARAAPAGSVNEADRVCDLGLAHGVPGVVALLAAASASGVATARPLLERAVDWLLAQRQPRRVGSTFAYMIPFGNAPRRWQSSRVAWCYGDLGAATAMYWASLVADEPRWAEIALDIATGAAERPIHQTGVLDAGLCHGAAGNAHLFNRLYQASGSPVFLKAAIAWLERVMSYYSRGTGIGGFREHLSPTEPDHAKWRHAPGILTGAAGIGLTLLASLSAFEPEWDRMLLVSLPPNDSIATHAAGR